MQKISKKASALNDMLDHRDLTDIYRETKKQTNEQTETAIIGEVEKKEREIN